MKKLNRKLLLSRLDVGLELSTELRQQLYKDLDYEMVVQMMDIVGFWSGITYDKKKEIIRSSILVDKDMYPDLYKDLKDTQKRLGYKGKINLYINNASEQNAYSMMSFNKEEPHIIVLNAFLVNMLNDNQVRFIIGHEIGHLMNNDLELDRLVDFLYPSEQDYPELLKFRLKLIKQLNELRADRCGCIACGDFNESVLTFLVFTSGINHNRLQCDMEKYIDRCRKNIDFIKQNANEYNNDSHPESPFRVRAMEIFAKTDEVEKMRDESQQLIDLLHSSTDISSKEVLFFAVAGMMMAKSDGKIDNAEMGAVFEYLQKNKVIFPEKYTNDLLNNDLEAIYDDLLNQLKHKEFKCDVIRLLGHLMKIMAVNQEIDQKESDFAYQIAKEFGITDDDFINCFTMMLRLYFQPLFRFHKKENNKPKQLIYIPQ